MNLETAFSSAQLAVAVLALLAVSKWGLNQFETRIFQGLADLKKDLNKRLDGLETDISSRPTRVEMMTEINAVHTRLEDNLGLPPRRRMNDETFPGAV